VISPRLRRLLAAPDVLYRLGLGPLLGRRFLRLTHRGRKTGRLHRTVLEVVHFDRERHEAIVASGWGRKANWFRNVTAGGAVEVEVGRERFAPEVRVLEPDEAAAVFAGYERRNRLATPVIRFVLSRLAGFRYDGGDEGRRRLVETLPLVGFRRP
jgi:deazaflavin-dependent oxidoreductase (nitroreductase family)